MKAPKHVITFTPMHNRPGKKDVTGAFAPEARAFARLVRAAGAQCVALRFDERARAVERRAAIARHLQGSAGVDAVAFFCHGTRLAIQAGYSRATVAQLARALAGCCTADVVVALYCCSTGADGAKRPIGAQGTGERSFADSLRDALCAQGLSRCRVVAHATAAHTTRNPHVVFFEGAGDAAGGVGGAAPVTPEHALWPRWRNALRKTDLRLRFPFMEVSEIHRELGREVGHV